MTEPRADREPWFAVKVNIRRNRKLAALPDDSARLGYVVAVMAEAKQARPMGVFATPEILADSLGRFGRYTDDYLAVGLTEQAPDLCERCSTAYGDPPPPSVVVHDFLRIQRDPTAAIRQAEFRARRNDVTAGVTDDVTPDVTDDVTRGVTGDVTDDVTAVSRLTGQGQLTGRRGGGTPVVSPPVVSPTTHSPPAEVVRPRNGATAPPAPARSGRPTDIRLTARQSAAWATYSDAAWRPFRTAWLGRGLRTPPPGDEGDDPRTSARARLYAIADARPNDLGRWVSEAPAGAKPGEVIGYVFEQWNVLAASEGGEPIEEGEGPGRKEAAESMRTIMARMAGQPDAGAVLDEIEQDDQWAEFG